MGNAKRIGKITRKETENYINIAIVWPSFLLPLPDLLSLCSIYSSYSTYHCVIKSELIEKIGVERLT